MAPRQAPTHAIPDGRRGRTSPPPGTPRPTGRHTGETMTTSLLFPFTSRGNLSLLHAAPPRPRKTRPHSRGAGTPSKPQRFSPPAAGRQGGEGERHGRTRADDGGKGGPATSPLPEGGPHEGPRKADRGDGPGRVNARHNRQESHRINSPERSRHTCVAKPTPKPDGPHGGPRRHAYARETDADTHRCRPTKTHERQWVPASDDAPDAASSRSPTQRPAPESENPSRQTQTTSAPWSRGRTFPQFRQPWERCRGRGGDDAATRTKPESTRHAPHTAHGRVAGAAKVVDASGRDARDGRHG